MTKTKLQQAIAKAKDKQVKRKPVKVIVIKKTPKPAKHVKARKPKRHKDGKWKAGQSGNPKGREKGLSITELVRKELLKDRKSKGKLKKQEYAKLLISRILKKAIEEGDSKMIDKIWAYMDGMPKQSLDANITGDISLRELCKKAKGE